MDNRQNQQTPSANPPDDRQEQVDRIKQQLEQMKGEGAPAGQPPQPQVQQPPNQPQPPQQQPPQQSQPQSEPAQPPQQPPSQVARPEQPQPPTQPPMQPESRAEIGAPPPPPPLPEDQIAASDTPADEPPKQSNAPKINPLIAGIGVVLFLLGGLIGFFVGRATAPQQANVAQQQPADQTEEASPEAETELPLQPDQTEPEAGDPVLVPMTEADDFSVFLPEPTGCGDDCYQDNGVVFQIVSGDMAAADRMPMGDPMMDEDEMMPVEPDGGIGDGATDPAMMDAMDDTMDTQIAMEDNPGAVMDDYWVFTVSQFDASAGSVPPMGEMSGMDITIDDIARFSETAIGDTDEYTTPTGESVTFTRLEDATIDGYEAMVFSVTLFPMALQQDIAIFTDINGITWLVSYVWMNDRYSTVFDEIIDTFAITGPLEDNQISVPAPLEQDTQSQGMQGAPPADSVEFMQ